MTNIQKILVAKVCDLPIGERKIVTIKGRSIGIFNVNGEFIAVLNVCPHELAPVCMGRVSGTTTASQPGAIEWVREGEILYCPWHGWEFDLLTGACFTDRRHLHKFVTSVEDDSIYVHLRLGNKGQK